MNRAKIVPLVSIVKVKKKTGRVNSQTKVQIQRGALIVQQVGRQKQAARNVEHVELACSVVVVKIVQ